MNKSTIGYAIWIFALLLLGQTAQAQYGFGTKKPSKAAIIEMQSSNKGLLIPRVALTSTAVLSPITDASGTAETNSLLVYNTATTTGTNAVTPGFYYWVTSDTRWKRIAVGDEIVVYTAGDGIAIDASNKISAALGTSIESTEIDDMSASNGQVLTWNGTSWTPSAAATDTNTTYTAGTGITITGANNEIASTLGTSIDSGEITDSSIATADIANAAVTTGKINSGGDDLVLTTSATGTVEWMSKSALVSGSTTSGDVSSSDGTLTVTDGGNAALKDVNVAITPGTANQVLVTNNSNAVAWVDQSDFQTQLVDGPTTDITGDGSSTTPYKVEVLNDAITSAKIKDGEVSGVDIANMSATSGQVLTWNATTMNWEPTTNPDANDVYTAGTGIGIDGSNVITADLGPSIESTEITDGTIQLVDLDYTAIVSALDGDITSDDLTVTTGDNVVFEDVNIEIATDAVTTTEILDGTILGTDINPMSATTGQVLAYDGTKWAPSIPSADASNITGKENLTLENGLEFTAGNGVDAILDATKIGIKNGGVTTVKLKDEAVTTAKIDNATIKTEDIAASATPNQLLVTDNTGVVAWNDMQTVVQNNQTADTLNIKDGVVTHTEVDGDAQNFRIVRHGNGSPAVSNPVSGDMYVDDTTGDIYTYNGTAWIQKTGKSPKFFYMPSVIFNSTQNGTGLTRDLYQDYLNQFTGGQVGTGNAQFDMAQGAPGSSMPYNGGLVGSTGAPVDINTYNKEDLYYYISYYDTSVFANLSIDKNGVLTYDIIGNATNLSYMTIIFVVK